MRTNLEQQQHLALAALGALVWDDRRHSGHWRLRGTTADAIQAVKQVNDALKAYHNGKAPAPDGVPT